ncbi:MAG: Gfo/Idh/MocA family oxidoreductase [bacterium]|nr:Gfo/Idh/MocA family oxidoreductase [bacterium]
MKNFSDTSTKNDMLRVGIIGSGFGVIGLKPAFESVSGCKVIGVCEGRNEWRAFLENESIDAIAIAVPPQAQYIIAKAAIKKGLHVFAEKPLAANLKQARELYALAKKKKVITGIDFIFPEIAEWKKVKELLDKNTSGALKHISVNWNWMSGDIRYGRRTWKTSVKDGGGALSFYFSHGLYYLENFAGKIRETKTLFTHSPKSLNGGEVGLDMLVKFQNGATGDVHVSCNTPGIIRHRLMFVCERGIITLENKNAIVDNFAVKIQNEKGEKTVKIKKDNGRKQEDERVKIVRKLAKKFVVACTRKEQMEPSFADGLRVQELIQKIRNSSRP